MKLKTIDEYLPFDTKEEHELQVIKEYIKNNSDVLLRNNKIAHITVSAWVLNSTMDKVLMAYHNIYNSWGWLGGHADGNADLCQVAVQEVKEETGLNELRLLDHQCLSIEILPVLSHIKNEKYVNSHLHFNVTFAFIGDENQRIKSKKDENKAVQWIAVDQINNIVKEKEMIVIYNKLMKRVVKLMKEKSC